MSSKIRPSDLVFPTAMQLELCLPRLAELLHGDILVFPSGSDRQECKNSSGDAPASSEVLFRGEVAT